MRRTLLHRLTRSHRSALPAVAGLLLLTACGSGGETAGPPPVCGPGSNPSASAETPTPAATTDEDGVTVLGTGGGADSGASARPCAVYTLTNREPQPFTYVVTIAFRSESGRALGNVDDTVETVAPGRTVRRTVNGSGLSPDAVGTADAKVLKVRGFPTAEAPSTSGACPPTGVRVYADEGDAAMGLRVVGLHLENCGTRPYRLNGYPRIEIRDEDHERVGSVSIVQGGEAIAGGTGAEGPPRRLELLPGERAHAGLVWRNTVEGGVDGPVNAPYARVWAKPGAAPVTVIPELDLGTTGRLGVGPWKKDEE